MRFLFTCEDGNTHSRSRLLRGGLIKNYHTVIKVKNVQKVPQADFWFHGISPKRGIEFSEKIRNEMEKFQGKIVFFQNDDGLDFTVDKIPDQLIEKGFLFLRNVWPIDMRNIDKRIRNKTGLINPFLKPGRAKGGLELSKRKIPISFIGMATGRHELTRVNAIQTILKAGLPFYGGIIKYQGMNNEPPSDIVIEPIKFNRYMKNMSETQISLVLHGNNPLTYRLFESLSRRCLVIAQDLDVVRFAGCGLKKDVHYISIKEDLSDIIDVISYYLSHLNEAQQIADNGYEFYRENFAYRGVDMPQNLYEEIVSTWNIESALSGEAYILRQIVKKILPFIHSL